MPFCHSVPYAENVPHLPVATNIPCRYTYDAVCAALKAFPKGKATGHLRIPGEALTVAAEIIAQPVTFLFPKVWTEGAIPDSCKIARIQCPKER